MKKICHTLVLNKLWTKLVIYIQKSIHLIWHTDLRVTNMYDQCMQDVLVLYFTFNSFFYIKQKKQNMEYFNLTLHRKFLTFSWHYYKFINFPDILKIFWQNFSFSWHLGRPWVLLCLCFWIFMVKSSRPISFGTIFPKINFYWLSMYNWLKSQNNLFFLCVASYPY